MTKTVTTERKLLDNDIRLIVNNFKATYGLLWQSKSDCPLVQKARRQLLVLMGKNDQADGINMARNLMREAGGESIFLRKQEYDPYLDGP